MVQESLDFAEHSVKMNPCWCKGYYRIEKANRYLGNNAEADKAITESKFISNYVEILKAKKKRSVIVENKMKKSPSWSLVKYKENVFLIDSEADKGHFSSLSEASEIVGRKQISFIVNPGKYLCNLQLLDGVDVDIVDNWNAIVCPKKKWLLKDSPVIIYNDEPTVIMIEIFGRSKLSLSRLSLFNSLHVVRVMGKSNVSLFQCFFS